MVSIESLKDYVGTGELMTLATTIYMMIDFICVDYPNHKDWYFTKQLPETINGNERNILFTRNPENEIIAIACLKKMLKKRRYVHCMFLINTEV